MSGDRETMKLGIWRVQNVCQTSVNFPHPLLSLSEFESFEIACIMAFLIQALKNKSL